MKYLYFFSYFFVMCNAIFTFEEFKTTFNKKYENSEEEQYRHDIFYDNLQRIIEHNKVNKDFKLKMNHLGDLYSHEIYNSKNLQHKYHLNYELVDFYNHEIPKDINWVKEGAVTPVKNQGHCGSCWAFSTTGALEGLYYIQNHNLVSFSEQQLMDCSEKEGDAGCDGGLMDYAFKYVIDANGICTEQDYPYEEHNGTCHNCNKTFTITGYKDVQVNNETALQYIVAQQPVSVAIQADSFEFQFYSSGVFTGYCGNPSHFNLDHGVLVVGYGIDNITGLDYWLVKNSWGLWGDQGYIKLQRNVHYKEGKCGIAMSASYPVNCKKNLLLL